MSKPEPCPNPACDEGQVVIELEEDGSKTMADCELCGGSGEEDMSCTFCRGSGGGPPPFVCPFCKGTGSRRKS